MIKTKYIIIAAIISAMALFSCGQDIDETDNSVQKRILKAYIGKYHPDATLLESGTYLLDSIPGTGKYPTDSSYMLVSYCIKYMDGIYADYTYDSIAKQLGEYKNSGYYYPVIWKMENLSAGVAEIMRMMREGGSLSALIPAWHFNKANNSYSGEGASKIYEVQLHEIIEDIDRYEYNIMKEFSSGHFNLSDTVSYGYFFDKITVNTTDTIKDGASVKLRYVGRYMDNNVFDTNIPDTAKRYRIFSGDESSYEALSFKHYDDESKAITGNTFVKGFSMTANRLVHGEKAVSVFYHELGYGVKGSGDIPGYIPLCFEIWVETEEE